MYLLVYLLTFLLVSFSLCLAVFLSFIELELKLNPDTIEWFDISADVDKCAVNNGGCDHYCQSAGGEVSCTCKRGFHVSLADTHKCEGNYI